MSDSMLGDLLGSMGASLKANDDQRRPSRAILANILGYLGRLGHLGPSWAILGHLGPSRSQGSK